MSEQKNMFAAILLSMAVFFGFNYFFPVKQPEQAPVAEKQGVAPTVDASLAPVNSKPLTREESLSSGARVLIQAPKIHGSINLTGARIDDVVLNDYRETTDPKSPQIVLLSPSKTENPYFADFGWISSVAGVALPTSTTQWKANRDTLTQDTPVVLSWDNGQGLVFERTIAIDDLYMFSVTDRVINKTGQSIKLNSYGQISRVGTPQVGGFFILHEGPIGVINGKLTEWTYAKLKETGSDDASTTGGWLGITDKYWLVSLIPDQKTSYHTRFKSQTVEGVDRYQTETISPEYEIAAGSSQDVTYHFFSGAKILRMLDAYEQKLGFTKFDLAVDFGWFYFLTKPLFYFLEYINKILGNLGLAILFMTVVFKVFMFPLANKSYRSMSRMKDMQPKMEVLRQRYANDTVRMNQELMELYRKEKINPLSGCLPMLIQAPLFFCLYKVLFVTIEMRQAPFYGWIHDLSAPDPTSVFNLFGLLPFTPPHLLMIGAWPLIMGATMLLQQKMSPQPTDPVQAKMFMIMPVMMTVFLAGFPAGLVVFWAWSNVLTIAQQWYIMRQDKTALGKVA